MNRIQNIWKKSPLAKIKHSQHSCHAWSTLEVLYVLKVQSPLVCQDCDPSTWFSFPACERTFFVWPKKLYSPCSEMARCHAPQFISSTPNGITLEYCTDRFTWRTNGQLMFKQNDSPGSLPLQLNWLWTSETILHMRPESVWKRTRCLLSVQLWGQWWNRTSLGVSGRMGLTRRDLKIAATLEVVWTCLRRWPWMWKGPNFNWVRFWILTDRLSERFGHVSHFAT